MNPPRKSSRESTNATGARDAAAQQADQLADQYRALYPRLTGVAAAVLGRAEGAEDVVQQAAQIAIAKGRVGDSPQGFVKWLAQVVRNCARNHRRRGGRMATLRVDLDSALASPTNGSPTNDTPVDPRTGRVRDGQSAFDDEVVRALNQLGEDARCCLLLRVVHDLSYTEISELLGLPAGTAMSHVHRSKQAMRDCLNAAAPTDSPTAARVKP